MMNIYTLIKQVPNMNNICFDFEKGTIDHTGADSEMNPFDLYSLQAAVDIAKISNGTVTAICMGPSVAEKSLRDALSRGANNAILLTDPQFSGSDTLATARVLAAAITKLGMPDLITVGEKTIDGDTGQVGGAIAELLNIPYAAYIEEINTLQNDTSQINVVTKIWGGRYILNIKLPCLITITNDINTPKPPSLKNKRAAEKAMILRMSAFDLDLSTDETGVNGSPTNVSKIVIPEPFQRQCEILTGDTNENIDRLITQFNNMDLL